MKPKKQSQPSRKDIEHQKQTERRLNEEKVELDHPEGKERFERVIGRIGKMPKKKK